MRELQQPDSMRSEQPKAVHEYRAALFSIFLHREQGGALSKALPPELRPVPLQKAMELVQDLPDEGLRVRAQDAAEFKLADAALLERKSVLIEEAATQLSLRSSGEDRR
ncbi:hypothetical protein [Vitiosangium sp. GDMCC 1.1324]|uniref:hypothetical protein n=1 Tax=Vitiosangium sp. (strain GDMCC 1.1324) TaxID=2138576 RepID=UPI000D3D6F74|nr:hypothetical protein [Vitiosangium sp. GDMCC 1.1324]PTL75000.1 hypothetical protein DAT35_57210 [Vitiosangium sp. GDMCC 1.1324]